MRLPIIHYNTYDKIPRRDRNSNSNTHRERRGLTAGRVRFRRRVFCFLYAASGRTDVRAGPIDTAIVRENVKNEPLDLRTTNAFFMR